MPLQPFFPPFNQVDLVQHHPAQPFGAVPFQVGCRCEPTISGLEVTADMAGKMLPIVESELCTTEANRLPWSCVGETCLGRGKSLLGLLVPLGTILNEWPQSARL